MQDSVPNVSSATKLPDHAHIAHLHCVHSCQDSLWHSKDSCMFMIASDTLSTGTGADRSLGRPLKDTSEATSHRVL
jgi:hypothetical protein